MPVSCICLFVVMFICLMFPPSSSQFNSDLHQTSHKDRHWSEEEMIKFSDHGMKGQGCTATGIDFG